MRSKSHIKGHPLHPILVSFPITFFSATLCADVLYWFTGRAGFGTGSYYLCLAGIVSAFAAAVPGLIDYFLLVPPASTAKSRAKAHGILNTCMVALFIVVFFMKQYGAQLLPAILCEGLAITLMIIAAWKGGTLITRNQIGVDHRYAGAGKWKELRISSLAKVVEIKEHDKLLVDQMMLVHVNELRIVIGRTEKGLVAFEDHCSHRGGSLADGVMICSTVQCPWHGSQFDVNSGVVKAGPAVKSIRTYNLTEENGSVFLHLR